MGDPARLTAALSALVEVAAANDRPPAAWRTLAGEASARGFPSARAFREWCQRAGVTIREVAGVALVDVAEVDRVGLAGAARPVPPSIRTAPVVVGEIDKELQTRGRR